MVGWHHWLKGHEFVQTPRDREGQGRLVCYSPWGPKESEMTEWLNSNDESEIWPCWVTAALGSFVFQKEGQHPLTLTQCRLRKLSRCSLSVTALANPGSEWRTQSPSLSEDMCLWEPSRCFSQIWAAWVVVTPAAAAWPWAMQTQLTFKYTHQYTRWGWGWRRPSLTLALVEQRLLLNWKAVELCVCCRVSCSARMWVLSLGRQRALDWLATDFILHTQPRKTLEGLN